MTSWPVKENIIFWFKSFESDSICLANKFLDAMAEEQTPRKRKKSTVSTTSSIFQRIRKRSMSLTSLNFLSSKRKRKSSTPSFVAKQPDHLRLIAPVQFPNAPISEYLTSV